MAPPDADATGKRHPGGDSRTAANVIATQIAYSASIAPGGVQAESSHPNSRGGLIRVQERYHPARDTTHWR